VQLSFFVQNELIVLRLGGQAVHENPTSVSLAIVLAAGAVYHFAVLVTALAALPA
jgi:hypothetical protein